MAERGFAGVGGMNPLEIKITRCSNGFLVMGEPGADRFACVDVFKHQAAVARTPQELAAIVEAWAKENADPQSKVEWPIGDTRIGEGGEVLRKVPA